MSHKVYVNANLWIADQYTPPKVLKEGALVVENDTIKWLGLTSQLPQEYLENYEPIDCHHQLLTPGLIDCHTHLVYGGDRFKEFGQRLQGSSYEAIARQGGGIQSTVQATRQATSMDLFNLAQSRIQKWIKNGVTSLEIKSGYGLDYENERKILKVIQKLKETSPLTLRSTFLGAHALPKEYAGDSNGYIQRVVQSLPRLKKEGLVDAVDGFCETIGFSLEQIRQVFTEAKRLGLPCKLHAEQLSNQKGARLAAEFNALSADHLEYIDDASIQAMAKANTVAVLLPGAYYFLNETKCPPIERFRQYQVPMAVGTDANPGSSPTDSLVLMLNMACVLFKLTPQEALLAATLNAAKALGIENHYGSLTPGKKADLVVWSISDPQELVCRFGEPPCQKVFKHGNLIYEQG